MASSAQLSFTVLLAARSERHAKKSSVNYFIISDKHHNGEPAGEKTWLAFNNLDTQPTVLQAS